MVRPDIWVMIDRMDDDVHREVGGNLDALDVEGFCEMTSYSGYWGMHPHHFSQKHRHVSQPTHILPVTTIPGTLINQTVKKRK